MNSILKPFNWFPLNHLADKYGHKMLCMYEGVCTFISMCKHKKNVKSNLHLHRERWKTWNSCLQYCSPEIYQEQDAATIILNVYKSAKSILRTAGNESLSTTTSLHDNQIFKGIKYSHPVQNTVGKFFFPLKETLLTLYSFHNFCLPRMLLHIFTIFTFH